MATPTAIDVLGVGKSFLAGDRTRHVLKDVSLQVAEGEFVAIVGAMGTGKSTLLSLMAGLTTPDVGSVVIGGTVVTDVAPGVAFVFQNYSLLPWLTALENVRLAVRAAFPSLSPDEHRDRSTRALERVGLGSALERRPRQLSGGMRQRVALARAFATEPAVLFLDEPFGALDALTRETLQRDLAAMCTALEKPVTTVMVTNNLDEAILLADRIVPMTPGPPATLGTAIDVPVARPRSAAQMALDDAAARTRTDIIAALTAGAARPRLGRTSRNALDRPIVSAAGATPTYEKGGS